MFALSETFYTKSFCHLESTSGLRFFRSSSSKSLDSEFVVIEQITQNPRERGLICVVCFYWHIISLYSGEKKKSFHKTHNPVHWRTNTPYFHYHFDASCSLNETVSVSNLKSLRMEHTFFCRRSFISLLFQFLNQISRRYAIVFFGGLLYFSSPVNHSYLIQNTRTTNLITWIHRFTNHREDNGFPELAQRVMSRNCVSSTFIHPYLQIPHATRLRAHCSDPPTSAQYHP